MHSLLEGLIAGLAALGVGLIGKYRGWSPLQAAAAAAATAFTAALALRQIGDTQSREETSR